MPIWQQVLDHLRRASGSVRGFRYFGTFWFGAWLLNLVHPLVGRLLRGRVLDLGGFRVRLGTTDCTCLVNLACDYDLDFVRRHLPLVDMVIDAGANVGAFSYLVTRFSPDLRIIALEPERENFRFLT